MPNPQRPLSTRRGAGGGAAGHDARMGMATQGNGPCGNVLVGHGHAAIAHGKVAVKRGAARAALVALGGEDALNFDHGRAQQDFLRALDRDLALGDLTPLRIPL